MFGKNEIVGKKYFREADGKLLITSIFLTLQGEGPFRGRPAVFIRLAKCNLACSFCDTYFDRGDWFTIDEIETKIDQLISDYFKGDVPEWATLGAVKGQVGEQLVFRERKIGVVLTGGEPMLQDALVPLLERLNMTFEWTQIETNGTQWQPIPLSTVLVVSPKCAEKSGKPTKYLTPNEKVLARADCFKFVMCDDPDSPYSSVPDWALKSMGDWGTEIFVSPMNMYNREPKASKLLRSGSNDITLEERSQIDEVISFWEPGLLDMKANERNHVYAANYCVRNGCTLNLQIHLYASLA